MTEYDEVSTPSWPEILRACQDQLASQVHTSLPGIIQSYSSTTQTCSVQLAVQLDGVTVPALDDVHVVWPGGAAGFLHVPLTAGDTVLVIFTEEDHSRWSLTGGVSAPAVLARHGLHAVAIPGFRPATAPLTVTGGHTTLSGQLHLGTDGASDPVALKSRVETAISNLLDGIISAAGSVTAPGGGPAFVAALNVFKATYVPALAVGAANVKAT